MKPELNKKIEEIKKLCNSKRTIVEAATSQKTQIKNKINEIKEAYENRLILMKQYENELPSIDKELLLEKENEAYIEKTVTDLKEENISKQIILNQLQSSFNEIEHLVKIAETVKRSNILKSIDELNLILQWINKGEPTSIALLYQSSRDEYKADTFHQIVDGHPNTITLFSDHYLDMVIGGFTTQTWDGKDFKTDNDAFLFNLYKQKVYRVKNPKRAIFASPSYLAEFGGNDLCFSKTKIFSQFPMSYEGESKTELPEGHELLSLKEMEVFEVKFKS